jgi:hypothetical protein
VPPPAYLNLEISDAQVQVLVVIEFSIFRDWFGFDGGELAESGALGEKQLAAVGSVLDRCLRVHVDGLASTREIAEARPKTIEDHGLTWKYVHLLVRYPVVVPPQQVGFVWTGYESEASYVFSRMDAELEAYGETTYPVFREKEPEFIWHRPREVLRPAPVALPAAVVSPRLSLPWASLACVALALFFALRLRRRVPVGGRLVGIGAACLLAWPLAALRVDVPLPFDGELQRPADSEALSIFASLHRGVYTALQGEDESEVYDALATSVTGELLPKLYMDVNQSLVMESEGGAIARIQKTEIDEVEVLPDHDEGAPWFKVRARWRVEGKVGHWGHTHQRINRYLADVTVLAKEGRWKIAAIDVLDEVRLDDGQKVR